jgi:hypothetical protein
MNVRRLARESVAVGAAALLGALWVIRAWEIDPAAPLLYRGDALLHLALIQNVREVGWYDWGARLAAPFGQDVRDFPLGGENLHWLVLKLLGSLMPSAAATATAYLLLTYVLVAMAMYVVARLIRLRPGAAVVVALLFAFLPFHQMRWTMHLLRSGYYPVPLGALAILWVLDWRRELREQTDGGPARWRRLRVGFIVAVGALLGSSDTQNAFYAAVVLLPVAVLVAWRDRDRRPLVLALAFSLTAGSFLVANNLPYLLARAERGPNPDVLNRAPGEQELYGLRLARLVLPVEKHRLAPLAAASAAAVRWAPRFSGEAGQALGAVGTLGFFVAIAAVGAAALGRPLLAGAPVPLAPLGLLILTAVLWATVGGFAYLLSLAGLTSYRTWNRMSLWIALFSLIAAGSVLQGLLDRLRRQWVAALIVAAIVVIGLLDQVPATFKSFDPEELSREWNADAAFFRQVEGSLAPGAMVYQSPAMPFPEGGRRLTMGPYEHLKPYLHTTALRFSYGGMKGRREGVWWQALDPLGPAAATSLLALAGFDARLVDRRAYFDGGAALESAMARVGAVLAVADPSAQRALWDLRPVRERLGGVAGPESAVGRALFDPLRVRFDDSFYADERDAGGHHLRWTAESAAEIRIDGGEVPRRVVVTAAIDHFDPAATVVTVAAAGATFRVPIAEGPATLVAPVEVPAGGLTLQLFSDGQPLQSPAGRQLGILVSRLSVVDTLILERLCSGGVAVDVPCDALRDQPAAAS